MAYIIMKKYLLVTIILISYIGNAQTNTFPLSGNVGLGTTNPISKLHVSAVGKKALRIYREGATDKYLDIWHGTSGAVIEPVRINGSISDLYLGGYSNPTNIFMSANGGKVGIGTTSPTAKLQVIGNLKTSDYIDANQYISVSKDGSYRVALNGQEDGYITGRNNQVEAKFLINSNGSSYLNGGNVGIGTTTPDAKLAVNGNIHTKRSKSRPIWLA